MAIGSGLSAQLGVKAESTYGTPVTVDRFYEFTDESLKLDVARLESKAIRSGARVLRSDRWASGKRVCGGSVGLELTNKSFGLLFTHMFGAVATTQPSAGPDPTVYDHTFTPGDLAGKMLTTQVGRPDIGGTVRPFTYHGCKVAGFEISGKVDEIAGVKLDLVAEDEDTSTGLATVTYPATLSLLTFVQGTLTVAGAAVSVREATVKGDNGLKSGRHFLGSALTKEPLEAALRGYTGSLDADFESLTAYNRYVDGTEAALVLLFQGAIISTTLRYQLQVTCNVRFDGETPQVKNVDMIPLSLPFTCLDSGAGGGSAITAVYRTTDVTP